MVDMLRGRERGRGRPRRVVLGLIREGERHRQADCNGFSQYLAKDGTIGRCISEAGAAATYSRRLLYGVHGTDVCHPPIPSRHARLKIFLASDLRKRVEKVTATAISP